MNAGFKLNCCLSLIWFLVLSVTVQADPIEFETIEWSLENRPSACTNLKFEIPASVVPVQHPRMGSNYTYWTSYDEKFVFTVFDNPYHLGLTQLSNSQYKKWAVCRRKSIESDCKNSADKQKKVFTFVENSSASKNCKQVVSIALDPKGLSRFVFGIEFCGPASEGKILNGTAERIWRTLEFSYQGCCAEDPNYWGCKS
jgi:hypothetical protein